jgi:hypothetical protein
MVGNVSPSKSNQVMTLPFYSNPYGFLEHIPTPKEVMASNKARMAQKAKKTSEKYRLIKK